METLWCKSRGLVMKSAPQTDTSSDRNMFAHVVWEATLLGIRWYLLSQPEEEGGAGEMRKRYDRPYYFRKTLDEIDPRICKEMGLASSSLLSHTDGILSALNRDICCIVKRIGHTSIPMEVLGLVLAPVWSPSECWALDDKYASYCLSGATPELLNQTRWAALSSSTATWFSSGGKITTKMPGLGWTCHPLGPTQLPLYGFSESTISFMAVDDTVVMLRADEFDRPGAAY
ncbi:uncharacterized protein ATNIH1004_001992 [Aspergillus tanneri]|uniref:Uncharacterized protein n=1 Tax=Aspergillus tanneri TaxID=1220188 RepID=A0A5M9M7M4_9EURO|nr:uncharacterized protein ATNIH1004_001992 [Aspergillus tanneri]KAA8641324.1 hypothetical protein ATNIH1004_001992 [Aspergillus tanneri]